MAVAIRANQPGARAKRYRFRLLRYVPNLVSGEYFNIGVLLFDDNGDVVAARFAQEFDRLECHPLSNTQLLREFRKEFDQRQSLGDGFGEYVGQMAKNLSAALQISVPNTFWGAEPDEEIERLYQSYVATPSRTAIEGREREPLPGSRAYLRRQMDDVFRRYHLVGRDALRGLLPDTEVNYGSDRLRFTFDYSYRPNGTHQYVHGIALRHELNDAQRLCLVTERLKASRRIGVTAVVDSEVPGDTRELLAASQVRALAAAALPELALEIRAELGL